MPKILVVDDSAVNRDILKEILTDVAVCDFVEDALKAIDLFNRSLELEHYYDILLVDIGLPKLNGIELLRKIRQEEKDAGILRGEGIPIIMVTAFKDRFLEAYDIGCHEYVIKPIDPDLLLEKVKKYLPSTS